MKAIAIFPGKENSIHLENLKKPTIKEIKNDRGVLVKVLRTGVCGTDKEINDAEYGKAPSDSDFLIIGHESIGIVEEIGKNVTELNIGDLVVPTVRRPANTIYDELVMSDFTTSENFTERGIKARHGYLTEYFVEETEFLIKVPKSLEKIGTLLEPLSIIEKGIDQTYKIQERLKVWTPKKAAVIGAGSVGLLAVMALRLRGLDVTAFARTKGPYINSDLVEELGARYISTEEMKLSKANKKYGPFDIIFEATGNSKVAFESAEILAKNGVLILSSVTGGDEKIEISADKINLEFVLGNKLMFGTVNANREDFELGIKDLVLAEAYYPGWLSKMITHKVKGLDNYEKIIKLLENDDGLIKVVVEI